MSFRINDFDGHKRVALGDFGSKPVNAPLAAVESITKVHAELVKGWVEPEPVIQKLSLNNFTGYTNGTHSIANYLGALSEAGAPPWKAFDGIKVYYDSAYRAAGWGYDTTEPTVARGGLVYTFPSAVEVRELHLWNREGVHASYNTHQVKAEGSNDGSYWTTLLYWTNIDSGASTIYEQVKPLTSVGSYSRYRLTFYNPTSLANTINVGITEVELWGVA